MNKVTYQEWVEIKQALKAEDGNVDEASYRTDRGKTTVRLVKRSKSFKQYKELTNK